LWQPEDGDGFTRRNVTVFADGEVDRSPCGSGTSARLALPDASGELAFRTELRHLSIIGTRFTGRVVDRTEVAGRPAEITEVEGSAYKTGERPSCSSRMTSSERASSSAERSPDYFLRDNAAPTESSVRPTACAARTAGFGSTRRSPNGRLTALITSCPAIRIPIVAAVPMREPANVTDPMIRTPSTAPLESQTGWRAASA
jgi:hypothetical protein